MFPFQRSCELSFKVDGYEDDPYEQQIKQEILSETINDTRVGIVDNLNRGRGRGRGRGRRGRRGTSRGSSSRSNNNNNNNNIDDDEEEKKRVFHRESERQRRLEMSSLFDSLRSIIPDHRLKGKSITDNIEEATNYIKDLEKNVKELGEKRDELKNSIHTTSNRRSRNELGGGGSSNPSPPYKVVIRQFMGGLEVEIGVKYNEVEFLMSSALKIVFDEGLDVVSSTSTKFNDRFIHSIQCEVKDETCIDMNRLEHRLNELFQISSNDHDHVDQ